MTDLNPYAPPATSEPGAPQEPGQWPRNPARRLWPLYVMSLLLSAGRWLWTSGSFRLQTRRFGDIAGATVQGYAGLAGGMLAVPPVALLGDRPRARLLVLLGLLALIAGTLLLLPTTGGLPLAAAAHGLGRLGDQVCGLLVMAYLLRGVTVRGAYLALLLLEVVEHGGRMLSQLSHTVGWDPNVLLLLSAGCAVLTVGPALALRPPATVTVPVDVVDPLLRPPMARARAVGLLLLLAGFLALASQISTTSRLGTSGLRVASLELFALLPAGLLGLALPLLAYFRGWAPRPLVVTGVLLTAVSGLMVGGARLVGAGSQPVLVVGDGLRLAGQRVLFDMSAPPLLRQNLPVERMARWYALYSLCWLATFSLAGPAWSLYAEPVGLLLAASGLTVLVGLVLLWVTRKRPGESA